MNSQPVNVRRISRGLAMIGFATLFLFGTVAKAQEQQQDDTQAGQGCTPATLKGSYGYIFSGFTGPYPAGLAEPFLGMSRVAAVGLFSFDGAGGLQARDTVSNNGPISHRSGAGTYLMDLTYSCTGTATLAGDFGQLTFYFVIVPGSHGREFSFLVTNQGTTATGLAQTTGDKGCSPASLRGAYQLSSTGIGLTKSVVSANVGFRILDGMGRITTAIDWASANGINQLRGGRGANYQVNFDCTVSEQFDDGPTFEGVVVAEGREAYFLRTGSKTVFPSLSVITVSYKKSGDEGNEASWTMLHHDESSGDDSGDD